MTPVDIAKLAERLARHFGADRQQVAAMLGVSLKTLQRLESGTTRPTYPRTLKLQAIATLLDTLPRARVD